MVIITALFFDFTMAPGPVARLSGYARVGLSPLLVLYGLYLIVPQFHRA